MFAEISIAEAGSFPMVVITVLLMFISMYGTGYAFGEIKGMDAGKKLADDRVRAAENDAKSAWATAGERLKVIAELRRRLPLSPAELESSLQAGGLVCPRCQSDNTTGGEFLADEDDVVRQPVECRECGVKWDCVYKLSKCVAGGGKPGATP